MPRRSRAVATRCTRAAKLVLLPVHRRQPYRRGCLYGVADAMAGPQNVFFALPRRAGAPRRPAEPTPARSSATASSGSTSSLRGASRCGTTSNGPQVAAVGAGCRPGDQPRLYGARRLRRRLRLRPDVPARRSNAADVVFSTVDTVGIPLILLKRAGLVRRPVVYTAIGLPERLVQLRGERMRRLYRGGARAERHAIVAYCRERGSVAPRLARPGRARRSSSFLSASTWRRSSRSPTRRRRPTSSRSGADPRRDFELLVEVASRRPGAELPDRRVGASAHAPLARFPANVDARDVDLPLDEVARASCRRPRRRAAGTRQQLFGRDDRAAAGDGAWQSRSSCHAPPRSRRATSSRTGSTAASSSPATSTPSSERSSKR